MNIENGEFILWKSKVPYIDIPSEQVINTNTIITTVDTLRH